jgi:sugar lactone lactonase YvrE
MASRLTILFAVVAAGAQAQTITTVAGNGTFGYNGDGIPAVTASLAFPYDVVLDSAGSLIIADPSNHRVRKVKAGTITTIAGTGVEGYNGDGIKAVKAMLDNPNGVAIDSADNVFIVDRSNQRIRRVEASTGVITTVAGNGIAGYGGDGGLATAASLNSPLGMVVDGQGNLIIADFFNNRIRRVDAVTRVITTIAGTGVFGYTGDGGPATSADLTYTTGVGVDGGGNVYVALLHSHAIRRVDASTGTITTVAGTGVAGFSGDGGPATSAQLQYPYRVTVDSAGNLFIADTENNRVRKVDAITGVINTIAGNGTSGFSGDGGSPLDAMLHTPLGIAVDGAGNWFVADEGNERVRRVGAVPTATVSGTAAICKGAATAIQAVLTGTSPWNLTWSDGVTQTGIAASPATRSVAPNATTTYTVTSVSDAITLGIQSGSAVVTVELAPKATVSGDTSVCAGSSTTIQADLTGTPPWNLAWSDGFTQTVSVSPATRSVSPAATTAYGITSLSDAVCAGAASGIANVKVDPVPSSAISAPASVCANSAGKTASVPSAGGQATYSWSISNGAITSGAGSKSIHFTAGGPPGSSVTITITVTSARGCTSTSTIVIPVGC